MESVNIEVYAETSGGEREVFAVVSEHRPDLPKPFDAQLQEWARSEFDELEPGDSTPEAGVLCYEPHGDIVEMRKSC